MPLTEASSSATVRQQTRCPYRLVRRNVSSCPSAAILLVEVQVARSLDSRLTIGKLSGYFAVRGIPTHHIRYC